MTSQKLEYDSSLGGPVVLATHVSTYRYAASAVNEMRQLLSAVRNPTSTKLVFQTLPKHMRRRAMSHHPKRLPRKYRSAHCSQMAKAGKPQTTKRPSRKHRRRPSNLLREYLRRQRRHTWLETHIWHARRFHMVDRWGYRLPYASCDKTYRACYRASAEHCLLQDISFHACVELSGSIEDLRSGFERLTSSTCGLGITAKTFVSGRREGSIELFRDQQYPSGALGRMTFIWRPAEEASTEGMYRVQRTLWLWIHPSAYQVALEELIKVFELVSTKSKKVQLKSDLGDVEEPEESATKAEKTSKPKKTSIKAQRQLQFMTKTLAYERIKHYANAQNTVRLSELKDTMNRYRLTGPLSQSVLAQAFKAKELQVAEDGKSRVNWFHSRLTNDKEFSENHALQTQYWQKCAQQLSSPAQLMSNMIVALNIVDPRLQRPQKRSKAGPPTVEQEIETLNDLLVDAPIALCRSSALWDSELRDHICEEMLTTHEYCEKRAKHAVVPGAPCKFEQELQPLPVLLIQRPGSQESQYKRLGYGCGWDIIAPAGYGMSIWLSLIMWGAKPGGLREFDSIARELGTEQHLPDTVGGLQTAVERHTQLKSKYFRLPSNKRCNYRKFAIASPFRVPFAQLVRDWMPTATMEASSASAFHILRDRSLLQQLSLCLSRKDFSALPQEIPPNCLIQLQLRMKSRGNPDDFSLICLPTRADFKRNLKQIKGENHDPVFTEPLLPDPNEKERKALRLEHKKMLKRLRARRVREKRKKQETSTTRVHIRHAGTSELIAKQFDNMCRLWLPEEDCSTLFSVRKQCSREVFGYVANAHFSFTEATVCGVGYVTVAGLKQLLDICRQSHVKQGMCLVRGTQTRHYRFAGFKLNLQV